MFKFKEVTIALAVFCLFLWAISSYWNFSKSHYIDSLNQTIAAPLTVSLSQHQKLAELISHQINRSDSLSEPDNIVLFLNQISNINENANIYTKYDLTTLGIYWIDLSQQIYGPFGRIEENLSPTQKINIEKCHLNPHQLIIFEPDLSKNGTTIYLGWGINDENKKILGTLLFGIPIEHINHRLKLINSKTHEISSVRLIPESNEFNILLFKKMYSKLFSGINRDMIYEQKLKSWPLSLEITYNNNELNKIIGKKILKELSILCVILLFLYFLKFTIHCIKNRSLLLIEKPLFALAQGNEPQLNDTRLNLSIKTAFKAVSNYILLLREKNYDLNFKYDQLAHQYLSIEKTLIHKKNKIKNQKKIIHSLFLSIKTIEAFASKIKTQLFEKANNAFVFSGVFRVFYEKNPFQDKTEISSLLSKHQSVLAPLNSKEYVKNNSNQFSIKGTIDAVLDMLSYHAIENEVEILTHYDLKESDFHSCEILFQQIIAATIYKVIEHTPREKKVDILIHDSIESTKRSLQININDNGFGVLYDFADKASTEEKNLFTSAYKEISWEMIKSDITLLNGSLEIISTIQEGTNYLIIFNEFNNDVPLNQEKSDNIYYIK